MLESIQLSKNYGSLKAVDDLNLQVNNELFIFLGPNGAGKTTTIKMMTGLLKPSSGTVKLMGFDIQDQALEAKQEIGLVPDTPMIYEKLSARVYINAIPFKKDLRGLDFDL